MQLLYLPTISFYCSCFWLHVLVLIEGPRNPTLLFVWPFLKGLLA